MKIGFIYNEKSYLPELHAYVDFFSKTDIDTQNITTENIKQLSTTDIDLLWKFTGFEIKREIKNVKTIHEYTSLSTGTFPMIKNLLKRMFNIKPDGRIFLNERVEKDLKFQKNVPTLFRDMGISAHFFVDEMKKEYDFVYVGDMEGRGLEVGLQPFTKQLQNKKIISLGFVEQIMDH